MQRAKIRILSLTTDGEGQEQKLEQNYQGTFTEKNGKFYAIYAEDAQSGLEGTKTTLKWDEKQLLILRTGTVNHRQEFLMSQVDYSVYETPYLKLNLKAETTYLYHVCKDGAWHLQVEYLLYHGEDYYGKIKLLMEIKPL